MKKKKKKDEEEAIVELQRRRRKGSLCRVKSRKVEEKKKNLWSKVLVTDGHEMCPPLFGIVNE